MRGVSAWLARGVHFTNIVDRTSRRFDRLRSALLVAFASDSFFEEYNALTYGLENTYRADSPAFRRGLFDWEERAVERFFPRPPARVLVGGAGGGREAFALHEKGYTVVAFDPADVLVRAMRSRIPPESGLRAYRGSYAELPILDDASGQPAINLADEAPFDAAVVGWASFSHLRNDRDRIETLQRFARLTRGPILVSYYPPPPPPQSNARRVGPLKGWIKRRMSRRGLSAFSVDIGYYRLLSHVEMDDIATRAGLTALWAQRDVNWPYLVIAGTGRDSPRR